MKYAIKDGTLVFEDLAIGNLRNQEPLSWDDLREVVMIATRFATKRKVEKRTLAELTADVHDFIESHAGKESKRDQELNNLKVQLAACQGYIERQNIEYNQLRKAYATGTVSE